MEFFSSFVGGHPNPKPYSKGTSKMAMRNTPPRQALPPPASPLWLPGLETFFGNGPPASLLLGGRIHQGRASGQPHFGDMNVLIIFAELLYN